MKEFVKKPIFWVIVVLVILAIYFAFFNSGTKIFSVGGGTGPAPGGGSGGGRPSPGGSRSRNVVVGGPYVDHNLPQGPCMLPNACTEFANDCTSGQAGTPAWGYRDCDRKFKRCWASFNL